MLTVALVGADGSGKSTIGARLVREAAVPIRYIYMGSNPESATHMLPTTRAFLMLKRAFGKPTHHAGPPDPSGTRPRPASLVKRSWKHAKSLLRLAPRLSEEGYRFFVASAARRRGFLILLDRHPFPDYYAHEIARTRGWRPVGDRVHGWLVDRVFPRPDALVVLDAPVEVLHARKPEGSLEALEARRREYLALEEVIPHYFRIDADRSPDEVLADVNGVVHELLAARG